MKLPEFPQRQWVPDLLKGWAVIWMILVHSVELFLSSAYDSHPVARLGYFMGAVPAAPVFMLMMGYFLPARGVSVKQMIFRGFKLIGWGLLLNLGLNLSLIIRWLNHSVPVNILEYVFGVDILLFAGLAVIISGLLQRLRPTWYIWMILAFLIPALNYLIHPDPAPFDGFSDIGSSVYLTSFIYGSAPWSYFPLVPWLSYVFAGIGLAELFSIRPQLLLRSRYHLFALIPALAVFLYGLGRAWDISHDLPVYYHHNLTFFIWALSLNLILAVIIKGTLIWKEGFVMKWIRFLGVRVTNVYVIQWLIIGNLGTWFFKSKNPSMTLLLFIAVLFVSTLITFAYRKIRFK